MILKSIFSFLLFLVCRSFVFGKDLLEEDYELIFKAQPIEVLIKYVTPYYKDAKPVFDKVNSIYRVKFSGGNIIEESRGKSIDEIDYIKKYRYIKEPSEIKKFCDEIYQKYQTNEIESLCVSEIKKKNLKMILLEMLDDSIFKASFEVNLGDIIKKYVFDLEFNLESFIEIKNKGNTVEENHYDSSGVLRSKIIRKKEKLFEEKSLYENEVLKKKILKEYRLDNTIRKKTILDYMPDGSVSSKIISEYNTSLLEDIRYYYDSNQKIYKKIKYEYEFDKKGNWIKMIGYDITNDKKILSSAVIRDIKY
jgi:hypothetical protein